MDAPREAAGNEKARVACEVEEGARAADLGALEERARILSEFRDYGPEALRLNALILKLDPDRVAALNRRGRCHLQREDFDAAEEDHSRALRVAPKGTVARKCLAEVRSAREAARERARKDRAKAEDLRRVEAVTSFEEAYRIGLAASRGRSPNPPLAEAALRKAWSLDPGRGEVRQGRKPNPKTFAVPTMLAALCRKAGRLSEARSIYGWVLERQDSPQARVGLAAVHEDEQEHLQALKLYEGVLERNPRDTYALHGIVKTFRSLGEVEKAAEAYENAVELAGTRREADDAVRGLEEMREDLLRRGDYERARWVGSVIERLRFG